MIITQVLSDYLLNQFPWWRGGQLRYEPAQKTVYVYCQKMCKPEVLLQEAEAIARLDIGIERFIITIPRVMDMVIECQLTSKREVL